MESPRLLWLAMTDHADKAASGWALKLTFCPAVVLYNEMLGGDKYILLWLYGLFFLDLLAGSFSALKRRVFSIRRFEGWAVKLATYTVSILLVGMINGSIQRGWGFNPHLLDTVVTFLLVSEALSILENLHEAGCPVPPAILRIIGKIGSRAQSRLDKMLDEDL